MKVALYARVSTNKQTTLLQEIALKRKAKIEGWEYDYFQEIESSRKTRPVKYGLYEHLLNKV